MDIKEAKHPVTRVKLTFAQKAADRLTIVVGSWGFIIFLVTLILGWILINGYFLIEYLEGKAFDPYPFILLNLFLSTLAAIQAPIILMSNNRQAHKNELRAEYDYNVDKKAEREIESMKTQLNRIEKKLK